MAESDRLARAHYRQQQALARQVAAALEELWRLLDTADLVASWSALADRAAQLVAVGQYAAATRAIAYVAESVTAQDGDPEPLGVVDPRALSGTAADGGPLVSLFIGGVYQARRMLGLGAPLSEALLSGQSRLIRAAVNEVVQAGISGASAAIGVTPSVNGYTRVLTPPSCSRCLILAGRHYPHSAGFLRHPRCDCTHAPYVGERPRDAVVNPEAAFRSMSEVEQDATFTKAGAEAIRQGADMGRVVNARQSTYVPKGRRTSRGTPTRRTVEDLLARAGGDRDKFAALLDSAGYMR